MPEGIEDNYVDELFLKGMAHKNSFPSLNYPQMIENTVEIIHVINSIFFQIQLYFLLASSSDGSKMQNVLFVITIALSMIGYIIYSYYKMYEHEKSLKRIIFGGEFLNNIKSIMFLSMILSLITPVLGSLTVAYSDDTIILDYVIFVVLHLIYYDFEMIENPPNWSMQPQ